MRLHDLPRTLQHRFKRPATWGAVMLFSVVWLMVRLATGIPAATVGLGEVLIPMLMLAGHITLGPLPWQWTGDERPIAPAWRGCLQALPWNTVWIGLVVLLVEGMLPSRPPRPTPEPQPTRELTEPAPTAPASRPKAPEPTIQENTQPAPSTPAVVPVPVPAQPSPKPTEPGQADPQAPVEPSPSDRERDRPPHRPGERPFPPDRQPPDRRPGGPQTSPDGRPRPPRPRPDLPPDEQNASRPPHGPMLASITAVDEPSPLEESGQPTPLQSTASPTPDTRRPATSIPSPAKATQPTLAVDAPLQAEPPPPPPLGLERGDAAAAPPPGRTGILPDRRPDLILLVFNLPFAMVLGWILAEKERAESTEDALQELARQARGRALQAQLHPHALYNVLSGLTELVHEDPDAAEEALVQLTELLRMLTRQAAATTLPLAQERALLKHYLAIEAIRLGPRLTVEWNWPDWADPISLPPLLLQPLVENAIKHGISPHPDGGILRIGIFRSDRDLIFRISNTGQSLNPSQAEGTGMRNLRERLALLKELQPSLELRTDEPWTMVELRLNLSMNQA